MTATPQQYKVKCIIAGKNVTKLNFYYDDTHLNSTLCNIQSNGFSCTTRKDNGGKNGVSSPSNVTVVSICATNVTVNWTYDTNDTDGYVVYYNNNVSKVEGHVKETTLEGLIPGTNYHRVR